MEYFDNVLGKMVKVHEEVSPEVGVNLKLNEPDSMKEFFEKRRKELEEDGSNK